MVVVEVVASFHQAVAQTHHQNTPVPLFGGRRVTRTEASWSTFLTSKKVLKSRSGGAGLSSLMVTRTCLTPAWRLLEHTTNLALWEAYLCLPVYCACSCCTDLRKRTGRQRADWEEDTERENRVSGDQGRKWKEWEERRGYDEVKEGRKIKDGMKGGEERRGKKTIAEEKKGEKLVDWREVNEARRLNNQDKVKRKGN